MNNLHQGVFMLEKVDLKHTQNQLQILFVIVVIANLEQVVLLAIYFILIKILNFYLEI